VIRTKSILGNRCREDGVRVCVMRFVRDSYDYDEWIRDLAPSIALLNDYRDKRIDWDEYEKRYMREMEGRKELIQELKKRSDSGEVISLLCWEWDDRFCHRRLLKKLIDGI
jgi:uncharacterized protein YeaO (DUF488 family)